MKKLFIPFVTLLAIIAVTDAKQCCKPNACKKEQKTIVVQRNPGQDSI